ncbi:hypothetical protein [uncultured Variovorax sp.]|jgi:hypothetical protein|uniref:hypothetical protein n=1 Tax=uncultured Variovorax sp. TaxID=114708 RepID=UPI0010F881F7|nr:hypothetical protein [uncultured Variovorax sp.]
MPFYRIPGGGVIHMRGAKLPAPCSEQLLLDGQLVLCAYPSEFLCDGPRQDAHGTCDRPLCPRHATQVGPDSHLCPRCRTEAIEGIGQRSLFTHLIEP